MPGTFQVLTGTCGAGQSVSNRIESANALSRDIIGIDAGEQLCEVTYDVQVSSTELQTVYENLVTIDSPVDTESEPAQKQDKEVLLTLNK